MPVSFVEINLVTLKDVKEHEEKNCSKNPDLDPKDTSDWYKCRICFKMIKHHRSLLRHLREKHDNAPEFE